MVFGGRREFTSSFILKHQCAHNRESSLWTKGEPCGMRVGVHYYFQITGTCAKRFGAQEMVVGTEIHKGFVRQNRIKCGDENRHCSRC